MTQPTSLPKFSDDPEYRDNCVASLLAVKSIFDATGVRYWLDFGTLLGYARHGDLLPNDDDIDIGICAEDWTPEVEQCFIERGFHLFPWVSEAELGQQLGLGNAGNFVSWYGVRHASLPPNRAWLDIFMYFKADGVRHPGHVRFYPEYKNTGAWEQPLALLDNLHEVDFLNAKFSTPVNHAQYLENLYGPSWQVPQERGQYGYGNFVDRAQLASHHSATANRDAPPTCKVSVVLPTYNHLDYLPQSIKSILQQVFTDFELIIVNDGSTDDTQAYLDTLNDPRIKVIHRANGGLPSALNAGFAQATGEYWTWTSADNFVSPVWLRNLVRALDNAPASVGFACSGFGLIDENGFFTGIRKGQNLHYDSLIAKNPGIASFLYRASVAKRVGPYDESLTFAEDWDMWLRILSVCDPIYVHDVLYYYRQHSNTMSRQGSEKIKEASKRTLIKLKQAHGGSFNLDLIYPKLQHAYDLDLASQQAYLRLSAMLIESPFFPPNWTALLLVQAINKHPKNIDIQKQLLHLLCRQGEWDLALQSVNAALQSIPSESLIEIRDGIIHRNHFVLSQCPIHSIPDEDLAFELGHSSSNSKTDK